jgi:hypothetical protein
VIGCHRVLVHRVRVIFRKCRGSSTLRPRCCASCTASA